MWTRNPDPRQKPPLGSRIDWSHPLAEGLVGCWLFNEQSGPIINLYKQTIASKVGNPTWKDGNISFDGASCFTQKDYKEIGKSLKAGCTIIVDIKPAIYLSTSENTYRSLEKGDCYFFLQGNGTTLGSGGQIFLVKSNNNVYSVSTGLPLEANVNYTLAGIFTGDQLYQWQNLQKFSGASVSYIDDDGLPLYIGADDSGLFWEGEVGRLLIFKRPISDIEYEQFYYEPYCFIEWPSRRICFDLGAGGFQLNTAWKIINSSSKQTSWKILTIKDLDTAWKIINGVEQNTSWKILYRNPIDTSWIIITSINQDVSWKIFDTKYNNTSWKILSQKTQDTAWSILTSGIVTKDTAWKILTSESQATAWRIQTTKNQDTAWKIANRKEQDVSWDILTRLIRDTSWGTLTSSEIDTSWLVFAVSTTDTAWYILTQEAKTTGWKVLDRKSLDVAWQINSDIIIEPIFTFSSNARQAIFDENKRIFIFRRS